MSEAERILQHYWASHKCPIYDGIVFGDASRVPIEFERKYTADETLIEFSLGEREWHREWVLELDDFWASLTCECKLQYGAGKYVECGQGSYGGDGYIACSKRDGALLWILYWEDANPFVQLDIRGKTIVALNSHREIWDLPVEHPEALRVSSSIRDRHCLRDTQGPGTAKGQSN